ncbi:MAG: YjjG family noncanonical pyrimidine nucleotidase [Candidatus Onthomonas sp.]
MVRFVFLDLDDTLLDFHRAEATALTRTFDRLDLPHTPEIAARYSAINLRHWELLEEGRITREQVLVGRFRQLFGELGVDADPWTAQECYEHFLSQGHWFLPGAPELLETLAPRYRLYLASNGTTVVQQGRIQSAGIAPYFQEIFLSQQIGADKPSPAFFDACFARIPDFDPAQAVMVGDSLTSDMRGGLAAGIRTCWFNPHHKLPRADIPVDREFDALEQLPAVLETL